MKRLSQKIKARILEQGPIPFSQYMDLCLFDPEDGYYSNLQHIGREGDFVTAPELGPYFAQAMGNFVLGIPHSTIVELGGGTGQFALDFLHTLAGKNSLPERYIIVDKSPSLKSLQQAKLAEFPQVEWVDRLDETGLHGVILANEFFDALPVERFIQGGELTHVDYQDEQFIETGEGERVEKCLIFPEVLKPILGAFIEGVAIIVDYGAERVERSTLTAYQNHQVVSPFAHPGEADITAHVDFTDLAEAFLACGWSIDCLKPQNQFLLEQGILPETGLTADNYALKRLLDPRLMGQLFKVMLARTCNFR